MVPVYIMDVRTPCRVQRRKAERVLPPFICTAPGAMHNRTEGGKRREGESGCKRLRAKRRRQGMTKAWARDSNSQVTPLCEVCLHGASCRLVAPRENAGPSWQGGFVGEEEAVGCGGSKSRGKEARGHQLAYNRGEEECGACHFSAMKETAMSLELLEIGW